MEKVLYHKSKSGNILKMYCTLTESALHPRSKSGNIFKSKSANILKLLVHPQSMNFRKANKSSPKVIWEELRRHPSRQRMDSSAACASCAMATAYEYNHSVVGTLHPHRSATIFLYVTFRDGLRHRPTRPWPRTHAFRGPALSKEKKEICADANA